MVEMTWLTYLAADNTNKVVDPAEKPAEKPIARPHDKADEKSKQNKRGSIFGRISGFGGVKSPTKEKDQHDAELKPEVPPKDDSAPQIPAPSTETSAIQPAITAVEPASTADIKADNAKPTEEKNDEVLTPSKEKPKFLSGLSFMNRNRSVSPSAAKTDEPLKTESEVPKTETPIAEPLKTDEPTVAPTSTEHTPVTALPDTTEKPLAEKSTADKLDDTPKETETSTPNKRQSVLGNLGRRASKAFRGMQGGPKKENTTPVTTTKDEPTTDAAPSSDVKPTVTDVESKPEGVKTDGTTDNSIGDVVPDAITAGQPQQSQNTPTVASAA